MSYNDNKENLFPKSRLIHTCRKPGNVIVETLCEEEKEVFKGSINSWYRKFMFHVNFFLNIPNLSTESPIVSFFRSEVSTKVLYLDLSLEGTKIKQEQINKNKTTNK